MALIPRYKIGKMLAASWALACITIILIAFSQRHVWDLPDAILYYLRFLTFPAGLVGPELLWRTDHLYSSTAGAEGQFWILAPYWVLSIALGYVQWFLALPILWRAVRNEAI